MIGQGGGGNLLPLLRKLTHNDGMDFAASAQEARDGIDVYSKSEVDILIAAAGGGGGGEGGGGLPPGGAVNNILIKTAPTNFVAGWSDKLLDVIVQGRDSNNTPRNVLQTASGVVGIGDNSLAGISLKNNTTIVNDGVGNRSLEIQTDGGSVPFLRFNRRSVMNWSIGQDGRGFLFSNTDNLATPLVIIGVGGDIQIPENHWILGGGHTLIAWNTLESRTFIGGPARVTGDFFVTGGSEIVGNSVFSNSLFVLGLLEARSFVIDRDQAFRSKGDRWAFYDRSVDNEMVYAYNTNACFNENAGRTLFHRAVQIDGNLTVNGTIVNVGGGGGAIKAWALIHSTNPLGFTQSGFSSITIAGGNSSIVRFQMPTPTASGSTCIVASPAAYAPQVWVQPETGSSFFVQSAQAGQTLGFHVMVTG